MLDGKLRIGPTCYHTLHIVPIMAAHEMNFLSDEGLKTPEGLPGYEILRDPMVPFGLEKLGIAQGMKERSVDIALDVQSRTIFFQRARGADVYIIAGWRNQVPGVIVGPPHIKSLQDVKGHRVGISDYNSIRHWALQVQLRKAGLDLEHDVEWIRIGPSRQRHLDALLNGKVECAPISSADAEDLKKMGFNVLATPRDQYPNGRPDRVIVATGRILEERPDLVKNFLKALIRSYWFVRDMPKNFEYICNLHRRMLATSADPEERERATWRAPRDLEAMPFPIDGKATGLEQMLEEEERIGGLGCEPPPVKEVLAQDLVQEAFAELRGRKEMEPEYQRVKAVAERWGY
jgi:ABC-type nitrate/sulfonate/bicarbonate transport system substrate-binding protein